MPSNIIDSVANKSNKTRKEVEKLWERAKSKVSEKFKPTDDAFWPMVTQITKKLAGINETINLLNFANFLKVEQIIEQELADAEKLPECNISPVIIQEDKTLVVKTEKLITEFSKIGLTILNIDYVLKKDEEIVPNQIILTLQDSIQIQQIEKIFEQIDILLAKITLVQEKQDKKSVQFPKFKLSFCSPEEGDSINQFTISSQKFDFVLL